MVVYKAIEGMMLQDLSANEHFLIRTINEAREILWRRPPAEREEARARMLKQIEFLQVPEPTKNIHVHRDGDRDPAGTKPKDRLVFY